MERMNKGITLIALVITIIIMLILAGIVLTLTLGDNGLIKKAQMASKNYRYATNAEENTLAEVDNYLDNYRENGSSVTGSNPKYVLRIDLPNTRANTRGVGTYYASTDFTKTEKEHFSEYLGKNDDGTWTVKKSGFYVISNRLSVYYKSSTSRSVSSIILGDDNIVMNQACVNNMTNYNIPINSITIFIESGTKINFVCEVSEGASIHHYNLIEIYALF